MGGGEALLGEYLSENAREYDGLGITGTIGTKKTPTVVDAYDGMSCGQRVFYRR